jgi:hypothetical protein
MIKILRGDEKLDFFRSIPSIQAMWTPNVLGVIDQDDGTIYILKTRYTDAQTEALTIDDFEYFENIKYDHDFSKFYKKHILVPRLGSKL